MTERDRASALLAVTSVPASMKSALNICPEYMPITKVSTLSTVIKHLKTIPAIVGKSIKVRQL